MIWGKAAAEPADVSDRPKRGGLRNKSKRRQRVDRLRGPVVEQVFERDGRRCQFRQFVADAVHDGRISDHEATEILEDAGDCFGDPCTPHELLPRGRAVERDKNLLDPNGITTLCAHHNGWASNSKGRPSMAERIGLLLKSPPSPSSPRCLVPAVAQGTAGFSSPDGASPHGAFGDDPSPTGRKCTAGGAATTPASSFDDVDALAGGNPSAAEPATSTAVPGVVSSPGDRSPASSSLTERDLP